MERYSVGRRRVWEAGRRVRVERRREWSDLICGGKSPREEEGEREGWDEMSARLLARTCA